MAFSYHIKFSEGSKGRFGMIDCKMKSAKQGTLQNCNDAYFLFKFTDNLKLCE
jgi:hypothetical protein